jgi:hypothetical protein
LIYAPPLARQISQPLGRVNVLDRRSRMSFDDRPEEIE